MNRRSTIACRAAHLNGIDLSGFRLRFARGFVFNGPAALDQGGSGAFARKGASTRFRGVDRFLEAVRRAQRPGTWRLTRASGAT